MLGRQHLVFGFTTSVLTCAAFQQVSPATTEYPIIFCASAMIGSLVPDVDSMKTKIGRQLPILSHFLQKHFGHRTITHDILLWSFVAIICIMYFPLTAGFWFGYLGHLCLDAFTKGGICWGYFLHRRHISKQIGCTNTSFWHGGFHLIPEHMRCHSDGILAHVITWCCIIGYAAILYATGYVSSVTTLLTLFMA